HHPIPGRTAGDEGSTARRDQRCARRPRLHRRVGSRIGEARARRRQGRLTPMPLVKARYLTVNPAWARAGSPAGNAFSESIDRLASNPSTDIAIAASGVELAFVVPVEDGQVISNVTFVTGATAANGPTAGYAVIRDISGNK